jgi:predicted PurR-regulated permease PerM
MCVMNSQKGFLLLLVGALLFLSALMLKPFIGYVLGAVLLAFILKPLQNRLSDYVGMRLSAFSLIILSIVLVSVPFGLIFSAVASDAQEAIKDVKSTDLLNTEELEQSILERTGQEVDIEEQLQKTLSGFVSTTIGNASKALSLLTNIAIGLSVMFFLVYYFLKDGDRFVEYVKDVGPLSDDLMDQLEANTYMTTWAVIKGHILVAIVQGLVAGIGLWVTGVPNYAFWTFVMILLAFIPIIGAFVVWGPSGIYLFMKSRPVAGTALLIYGATVVAFTDNFLRPLLVDRDADIHPAVIMIGVIGGVYVFGASGLFIGPIVFGALKAAMEIFKDNYHEL